jgi:hypothetical protein
MLGLPRPVKAGQHHVGEQGPATPPRGVPAWGCSRVSPANPPALSHPLMSSPHPPVADPFGQRGPKHSGRRLSKQPAMSASTTQQRPRLPSARITSNAWWALRPGRTPTEQSRSRPQRSAPAPPSPPPGPPDPAPRAHRDFPPHPAAWNGHPAHRQRPVGAALQLGRQGVEESLEAPGLDPGNGHALHAGSTPVATDLLPGALQDVAAVDLVIARMEASGRRPLGRPVQLALQRSGLVQGVVSHRAFTDRSLPLQARDVAGSFPRAGWWCPRPQAVLRPHPPPFRLGATSRRIGHPHRLLPVRSDRGRGGLPQFPHPPSTHPAPPTPEGSSAPAPPGLRRLPWPSP